MQLPEATMLAPGGHAEGPWGARPGNRAFLALPFQYSHQLRAAKRMTPANATWSGKTNQLSHAQMPDSQNHEK